MKTYLVVLFSAFLSFSYAQKIDIKKENILWDKKEIAKVTEPYRDNLVISTLTGEKQLVVDYKSLPGKLDFGFQWLIVSNADGSKKSEIPYEVLLTSFNSKRIIIHLLATKYNLINQDGLNKAEFDNFFAKNTENLTDKYTKMVVQEKIEAAEDENQKKAIISRYNPTVNPDKTISFYSGSSKRIAGKLYTKPYQMSSGSQDYVTVYDIDNNYVAKMFMTSMLGKIKVECWDGNVFNYESKSTYSEQNYTFLNDLIVRLIAKGYVLEKDISRKKAELLGAKINTAKEKSVNIYNQRGYLVDKDGVKYSGIVNILFQQLDLENTGNVLPEFGPDNYGQKVIINYKNESGKDRVKTFNASNDNYFVVYDANNNEVFYYGLKTKGEFAKKMQNLDAFKFNSAYYYKLVKKGKGINLYQDPVETGKYVIKTDKEEKGQMLDTRSNESLAKVLSSYLSDCKSVSKSISDLEFDLKIEQNLITIIEEYSECKK